MKRVVITGAAGFVGSAVTEELLAHGVEVYAVVRPGFSARKDTSRLASLPVHLVECDLRNLSALPALLPERGFDAWYQFAWDGLFGAELLDYQKQVPNISYVLDAIRVAAQLGCEKFIGSGSVSQYELQAEGGQAMQGDKHRVYKTAKLACEYMGRSVATESGIIFIWPIITNIYGVGESSPRLINTMIRNLQAGRHQSLSEGNQIYDFIYSTDAARAFYLIGEHGKPHRTYVIGSGCAQPLHIFLTQVCGIVAPQARLGFGELNFNGFYLPKEVYDISSLQADTGFSPEVSFQKGIQKTAEWMRKYDME